MIESNYILYAVRQYQKLLKNKKHFWLQKIEDYNLTKQKYFEYIQLYKNKKKSSQTKFYMHLNSIRNCKKRKRKKHYWLQKIEDYNLTKQKYFEYIQLYKKKKKIKSN